MGAQPQGGGGGRRMRRGEGGRGRKMRRGVTAGSTPEGFAPLGGTSTPEGTDNGVPSVSSEQQATVRDRKSPEQRIRRRERRADRLERRAAVQKERIGSMRSELEGIFGQAGSGSKSLIQKMVTRNALDPMRSKRDSQLKRADRLRKRAERLRTNGITAAEIGQSPQM